MAKEQRADHGSGWRWLSDDDDDDVHGNYDREGK